MNYSVTLYHSENADIKVDIEARFDGATLIIDEYDMGKRVEEYRSDSDYEYTLTMPPKSVQQLYDLMNVWPGDQQSLLQELAKRYRPTPAFPRSENCWTTTLFHVRDFRGCKEAALIVYINSL